MTIEQMNAARESKAITVEDIAKRRVEYLEALARGEDWAVRARLAVQDLDRQPKPEHWTDHARQKLEDARRKAAAS